jgi:predicted nucleic acid-binding Zn ribbon protein
MDSLHSGSAHALRTILDGQPTTAAKVAFIWRMAAGPALARAAEPIWRDDGVLTIRARSEAWRRELRRVRPALAARVHDLAGPNVIKRIVIE